MADELKARRVLGLPPGEISREDLEMAFSIRSRGLDQLLLDADDRASREKLLAARNEALEARQILLDGSGAVSEVRTGLPGVLDAGCPRGDASCAHRLHKATAGLACDLMCSLFRGEQNRRDSVDPDVRRLINQCRNAITPLSPAAIQDWFASLRQDIETCCPRGYDEERQEYHLTEVPASLYLQTPERALRASVVLSLSGGGASLECLRYLAFLRGTWYFETIEDAGDSLHISKRYESERPYEYIDPSAVVYLEQCLRHGEVDRVFEELDGPLADHAFRVLAPDAAPTLERASQARGAYFGTGSRHDELMAIYRASFTTPVPITEEDRRRLGRYLEEHARNPAGSPRQLWALRFFAANLDIAPGDLIMEVVLDVKQPANRRQDALQLLNALADENGQLRDSITGTLAAQALEYLEKDCTADPLLRDIIASIPPCDARTSLGLAVADLLAGLSPSDSEASLLIDLLNTLDEPRLRIHVQGLFESGKLSPPMARLLLPLLKPGSEAGLRYSETHAAIATLGNPARENWFARRSAIKFLLGICRDSEKARQALLAHLKCEQDYELLQMLERNARLYKKGL